MVLGDFMSAEKTEKILSPLSRARGTGSAHEGTHHWWHQRITAVTNLFLMLWLIWAVNHMPGWSYAEFTGWLARPCNAILMILSIISVFYHAALGAQVIMEDYIHNESCKIVKLTGMKLFFVAAGVACIFSVLKISVGG